MKEDFMGATEALGTVNHADLLIQLSPLYERWFAVERLVLTFQVVLGNC